MAKVDITIGYTRGSIFEDYKYWTRKNLIGADVKIQDGLGNKLVIGVREGGTKIELNGKVIKEVRNDKLE